MKVLTRSDRNSKTKSRGGGVAFYLKKNVKFSVIAKSENDSEIDNLFIKLKHVHLVCGVVYKPPDVNDSKLEIVFKLLSEISSIEPNVMLMGDLNINLEAIKTSKTLNFFENLNALSFKLLPTYPTCHKSDSSSTIDLFSGNCTHNVNNVYQSSAGGISDHDFICLDYKFKSSKAKSEVYYTREYHKIDTDLFISDLRGVAFDQVYNCTNVNEKLRCFTKLFVSILNSHAPLRRKLVTNPTSPWINGNISRLFKNRSDAYECWKRDKSDSQKWKNFTRLRNLTNREVERPKKYQTTGVETNKHYYWRW